MKGPSSRTPARGPSYGIISATGRSGMGITEYEDFMQTDAAINPGNSGGPLVSMEGRVVGINTAIFSRSGGSMGVGFAIPINMAKTVMKSIREKGRMVRGYLGVAIQNLTPDLADAMGLGQRKGALIADVMPDTPAAKAGLKRGDLVIKIEDHEIESSTQLRNLVARYEPGREVTITVLRNGEKNKVTVELIERPKEEARQAPTPTKSPEKELGFQVRDLDPPAREQFGIEETGGVVVVRVEPGSKAYAAGLRPGALILEVDGEAVDTVEGFHRQMVKAGEDGKILLLISYKGMKSYTVLRP